MRSSIFGSEPSGSEATAVSSALMKAPAWKEYLASPRALLKLCFSPCRSIGDEEERVSSGTRRLHWWSKPWGSSSAAEFPLGPVESSGGQSKPKDMGKGGGEKDRKKERCIRRGRGAASVSDRQVPIAKEADTLSSSCCAQTEVTVSTFIAESLLGGRRRGVDRGFLLE